MLAFCSAHASPPNITKEASNDTLAVERDTETKQTDIYYWYRNFDSPMMHGLLKLALEKTKDFSPTYNLRRGAELPQGRAIRELAKGSSNKINLIGAVPDAVRTKELLPIYVAVDSGFIGLRVCLIRKDKAQQFESIKSISDLQKSNIIFGQGEHWPDKNILQANGLQVVASAVYEPMYAMLKADRFTCFLRGISEVLDDMDKFGDSALEIEENLLFSYPSTTLFFVNKNDKLLAARLELGLRRAILDGSLAEFFAAHFESDIQALNISSRRVIRLNNPLLPDEMLEKLSKKPQFKDAKLRIY